MPKNSIPFVKEKQIAIDEFYNHLEGIGAKITGEPKELNKGLGLKYNVVFKDSTNSIILYFNTKGQSTKLYLEKISAILREELNKQLGITDTEAESNNRINLHIPILVAEQADQEKIKVLIDKCGLEILEQVPTEYMKYMIKIKEIDNVLTVTQFKSGKLLVQGIYSSLSEKILLLIDKIKPLSEIEKALAYVPEEAQEEVAKHFEEYSQEFNTLYKSTAEELSEGLFKFLFENDKKTLVTAKKVSSIIASSGEVLPEYNFLVAPYAKVFEGFIIKLMIEKKFFTLDEFIENPEKPEIGNALRKRKFEKYLKDKRRNSFVIDKLISIWEGTRCKEMHSDFAAHVKLISITNMQVANEKKCEVIRCMKEAYDFLIEDGLCDEDIKQTSPETTRSAPQEDISIITDNVIGSDESGKGDYLGPLVAAAVYVNEDTAKSLELIGVKDSKKLTDRRAFELAKEIERICKGSYSIIEIAPETYNKLYDQLKREGKNLNVLLAWGHAKAYEEILSKVDCKTAIADQFADEKFILNKLQEKGQKLELIQVPKAEQNIAVAAASILARARFLNKLKKLSADFGIELPKGASTQVVEAAKKIVAKHGQAGLRKVAKLHFKTTKSVIGN